MSNGQFREHINLIESVMEDDDAGSIQSLEINAKFVVNTGSYEKAEEIYKKLADEPYINDVVIHHDSVQISMDMLEAEQKGLLEYEPYAEDAIGIWVMDITNSDI